MTSSGQPPHAPPFHCPFCGEEDIRPHGEDPGQWRCGSCTRVWKLSFVGLAPAASDVAGVLMAAPANEHSRLRALVEQGSRDLDGAGPQEVLRWADHQFGAALAIASSMTDAVLAHLAAQSAPKAKIVFLDTGYHFAETIQTARAVAASVALEVLVVRPERTVAGQDEEHGPRLYDRDPDLCCALRKVAPLSRALQPFSAWAAGIRRDDSDSRRDTRVVHWDGERGMVKINPLVHWTQSEVDDYIAENDVLVNPLVSDGYPSIGCAPCTLRVAPGQDPRSGRWADLVKTECGLHA